MLTKKEGGALDLGSLGHGLGTPRGGGDSHPPGGAGDGVREIGRFIIIESFWNDDDQSLGARPSSLLIQVQVQVGDHCTSGRIAGNTRLHTLLRSSVQQGSQGTRDAAGRQQAASSSFGSDTSDDEAYSATRFRIYSLADAHHVPAEPLHTAVRKVGATHVHWASRE